MMAPSFCKKRCIVWPRIASFALWRKRASDICSPDYEHVHLHSTKWKHEENYNYLEPTRRANAMRPLAYLPRPFFFLVLGIFMQINVKFDQ